MASKIVGTRLGVSKKQQLHVVKTEFTNIGIHWAFATIAVDIAQHKQPSVVVYPASSVEVFDPAGRSRLGPYYRRILELSQMISKWGGIIVTSAAVTNFKDLVNTQPALMLAASDKVNAVIVGSTNLRGLATEVSGILDPAIRAYRNKQVWAPGIDIICKKKGGGHQRLRGVSLSTGMVSLWSAAQV